MFLAHNYLTSKFVSSCPAGNYEQRSRGMGEIELVVAIPIPPDVGGMRSRNVAVAIKLPSAIGHCRGWRIHVGSLEQKQFSCPHLYVQVHTHAAGGSDVLINDDHIQRTNRAGSSGIGADVSRGLCFGRQKRWDNAIRPVLPRLPDPQIAKATCRKRRRRQPSVASAFGSLGFAHPLLTGAAESLRNGRGHIRHRIPRTCPGR